jgi:DNA-binding response OmpR family regulator
MATVLIIERDNKEMRLLAWGMQEVGHTVVVSAGPDELALGDRVQPDVIVFNTGMARDIKRLWVRSLRYMAPNVDIIDLRPAGDASTYDTGADGYLEPPYGVDQLVALMESLRVRRSTASQREPSTMVPL